MIESKTKFPADRIILNWECSMCKSEYSQNLLDIGESGTAVCPECDEDCSLNSEVTLLPESDVQLFGYRPGTDIC